MKVVEMNQVMGKLFHSLSEGLTKEVLREVFAWNGRTRLCIHDLKLELEGCNNISDVLLQDKYRKYFKNMFHMLHSNAYETRGSRAYGHWNAHSFWLVDLNDNGIYEGARFGYFRFEAEFIVQDHTCKIQELDVRSLVLFKKWPRMPALKPDILRAPMHPDLEINGENPDADTYIQLRNLVGRFVQEGPRCAANLFSGESFSTFSNPFLKGEVITDYNALKRLFEEISLEEKRSRVYVFHMMAATPVFTVDRENLRADGIFMAQLLHFIREPGGRYKVAFWLGRLRVRYIKQTKWLFTDFCVEPLACISVSDFTINPERPMAMQNHRNWRRAPIPSVDTAGHADDLFTAESLLPQWTERLKRGDTCDFVELYMKNSVEEISMGMSGPRTCGYENVLRHCGSQMEPLETGTRTKRFPQFHIGASPVAELYDEGKYAEISWLDYGWGNIGYGVYYEENETRRMYRPMIGQYYHSYVRDNGQWKMYEFGWKPLIQWLPEWEYDTEDVDGWASEYHEGPWPLPFEKDGGGYFNE